MLRAKRTSKQALLALQARQQKMTEWLSLQTDNPQEFLDNYDFQESLFREEEELDLETAEEGDPIEAVAEKKKKKRKKAIAKVDDKVTSDEELDLTKEKKKPKKQVKLEDEKATDNDDGDFLKFRTPHNRAHSQFKFGAGVNPSPGKKFETRNEEDDRVIPINSAINISLSNNSKFEVDPIHGKVLSPKILAKLRDEINRFGIAGTFTKEQRNQCFDEEQKSQLLDRVKISVLTRNPSVLLEMGDQSASDTFNLHHDQFFRVVLIVYQENIIVSEKHIASKIKAEILLLSGWDKLTGKSFRELETLYTQVARIFADRAYKSRSEAVKLMTAERSKTLLEDLNKKIRQCPEAKVFHELIWEWLDQGTAEWPKPKTWNQWRDAMHFHYWGICEKLATTEDSNQPSTKARRKLEPAEEDSSKNEKRKDHPTKPVVENKKATGDQPAKAKTCHGCGMNNHLKIQCTLNNHVDYNYEENTPFKNSAVGKIYS